MGACCGKQSTGPDAQIYSQAQRSRLPDTEADRAARAQAAAAVRVLARARLLQHARSMASPIPAFTPSPVQAEARQQAWAGTAAGRAALKSVKQVQEERAQGRVVSNDTAKDWLS